MPDDQHETNARPGPFATTVLDSIADGVFAVDQGWRITYFNRAAEQITGIARDQAVGRPCCEVFRADICESFCALRETTETGRPVVNRAITIMRFDGRLLPVSISTALLRNAAGAICGGVETFRDLSVVEDLRKQLTARYTCQDIVAKSHRMTEMLDTLPEIALSGSTVLVTGESGTGKELIARAIHSLSTRQHGPFVAVNCGALPETLLESELFGHRAGSFTGASRDRPGRFRQAERGTLFLDELGDVSTALQVRLLRVLEEQEDEPVGASAPVRSDVRIVSATNRELEALVEAGTFRQDLYYRVNVVRVRVPPLRERKEDIPLLVDHFITKLNRLRNRSVEGVSGEVLARYMAHDWPGNVRELSNAVEHGFILCHGRLLEVSGLPEQLAAAPGETPGQGTTLREIEARAIRHALRRNRWRRMATARELGIDKTTLWRKMKRLGIEAPAAGSD